MVTTLDRANMISEQWLIGTNERLSDQNVPLDRRDVSAILISQKQLVTKRISSTVIRRYLRFFGICSPVVFPSEDIPGCSTLVDTFGR